MFEKTKDSRSPLYILLPFGLLLVLVLLLSGCGGQTTTPDNPSVPVDNSTNTGGATVEQPAPTDAEAPTEEIADPEPTAETGEAAPVETGVSFSADVFPILQSRCINCHGGDRIEAELVMRSYEDLMAGGESGLVITVGDSANSLLVQLVSELKMPKRGPKLTPIQIQTITDWVDQGALNN